jgi:hypothetical protein
MLQITVLKRFNALSRFDIAEYYGKRKVVEIGWKWLK